MTAFCAQFLQYKPHEYMTYVYLVSAISLAVPFVFHLKQSTHHTGKPGRVIPVGEDLSSSQSLED